MGYGSEMMIRERVKMWIDALWPDKLDKILEQKSGTLMDGIKNVVLSSLVPAICMVILFTLIGMFIGVIFGILSGIVSPSAGLAAGGITIGGYILMGVVIAVITVIFAPITFLIGTGVHWALARALGGKGNYSDQGYYASMITAAINVLTPILMILGMIPCFGYIVQLIVSIYPIFLFYKVIKKVHGLDDIRSAAVVILPVVVGIVLVVILYLLYFVVLFSVGARG